MTKPIIGGPDTPAPQKPRAGDGGQQECKELPYDPPKGPTEMYHQGPGLANHKNHGNCGTQGRH